MSGRIDTLHRRGSSTADMNLSENLAATDHDHSHSSTSGAADLEAHTSLVSEADPGMATPSSPTPGPELTSASRTRGGGKPKDFDVSEDVPLMRASIASSSSSQLGQKGSFSLLRPYLTGITGTAIALQLLGGAHYGYNTGVIAGANTSLEQTQTVSALTIEFITASILMGATIGSFFTGSLVDRYGRRPVAIVLSWTSIGAVIFLALVTDVTLIAIARGLLGLSIGGFTYISPLYSSETSPPIVRGFLGTMIQLTIVFFIFFGYVMNLAFINTFHGYRYMYGLGLVSSVCLWYVCQFRMKESPRWLVLQGRVDEARPLLEQIIGKDEVEFAVKKIQAANTETKASWRELFTWRHARHITIGVVLAASQQLTGNNAVTYYAPKILENAGLTGDTAQTSFTVGLGFFKFLCILVTLRYIDHFGRRKLLFAGLFWMAVGALGLGVSFVTLSDDLVAPAAMVFMLILVGGLEIGPGPLFYVIISEIYPDRVRGRAMSFANGISNGLNLTLTFVFLTVVESIGPSATFFIFAGITIASFMVLFALMPETKNRSLEEVQEMLQKGRTH